MFNMGGPIKEGIMHGIREPKKDGGTPGVGYGLVGDKRYPKTGGREHHWAFLPWLIGAGGTALRTAPTVYRGMKAARTLAPGKLGAWGRVKDVLGFGAPRYRATSATIKRGGPRVPDAQGSYSPVTLTPGKDMGILQALKDPKRFGMFLRERPLTSLTALTLPATAIDMGREHGPGVAKGAWNLTKRYAAGLIPGDQSHWYTDPPPPTDVPLNPNLEMNIKKKKKTQGAGIELTDQQRKDFAAKQRDERVQKYMDMMGYDRSKKTAVADALIDASKIVSDRGTLDRKNITAELINPIIQATSKRFDKPEQIREAVGLMAAKAEIQKDLEKETKAQDRKLKGLQIEVAQQKLGTNFEDDLRVLIAGSKDKVNKKQLERFARLTADKYGDSFTVVEDASVIADKPGVYMLEDKIFRVDEEGNSKQIV